MNVYDFDNTIYNGDSTFDFYLFCLKRNKNIIKRFPNLAKSFAKFYVFKKGNKTEFKENMYSFLKYIDTEKEVKEFWKTHLKNIKPWYFENQMDSDLIISASPEFLLKPICRILGIKHLIASKVSPVDGKYTGKNCHGKEKVRRFKQLYNEKIDEFYSDSYSDNPLALISKKSYMVKGDKITKWDFSKAKK